MGEKESLFEGRDRPKTVWDGGGMQPENSTPVTYVFIDAANVIYRHGNERLWKIDLKKLIKYLQERFGASKIFYFGGIDYQNAAQMSIYRRMLEWGYELRFNPVKHFVNDRGERYLKADVDSRMTFEIMRLFPEYDRAVILTGDGDFYWVLEYICKQKTDVRLLASPAKTAKELKQLFGHKFTNFDDLKKWLEYLGDS